MLKLSYDVGAASDWYDSRFSVSLADIAEKAGFDSVWMQDHFLPWYHNHAHSPQAWVWISSAAARTRRVSIASGVTAPMFKYHPAVVAHAFATLGSMFPGRIVLGVGSGEAMNEAPFVDAFPPWGIRFEMLVEAVQLIRQYWTSRDYFSFSGKYFQIRNAFCYDKPPKPIPIYFSAYGPKGAFLAGKNADHLVTWGLDLRNMLDNIFPQFDRGAVAAGKDPKKMEKAVYLDFAHGERKRVLERIRKSSVAWLLPSNYSEPDPRKIQAKVANIEDEVIESKIFIAERAGEFIEFLDKYRSHARVKHVILSDSSPDPVKSIQMIGKKVIPYFSDNKRN